MFNSSNSFFALCIATILLADHACAQRGGGTGGGGPRGGGGSDGMTRTYVPSTFTA